MRTPDEATLRRRVKEELRRRLRAVRKALPADIRTARSEQAATQALGGDFGGSLRELARDRILVSYSAIRGELDPTGLESALVDAGALLAFPAVDMKAGKLVIRRCERDALVEGGAFGVSEPPEDAEEVELAGALVLVPALAVDPRGHRVGYGKGFYDQLLGGVDVMSVAFVYDFQLVPEAPSEEHDVPVRFIVTDKRVMRCEDVA